MSIGQGKIFRIVPGAPEAAPTPLSFPASEQPSAATEDEEIEENTDEAEGENGEEPSQDEAPIEDSNADTGENTLFG